MTAELGSAVIEVLGAELARRDLMAFAERMDRRFENPPKHLQLIGRELQALETGEHRFLMINLPPRHAKTTLSSQIFTAYAIGRDPTREIILASHSVDLAERNSRIARGLLLRNEYPFEVRLAADSSAATRWHVQNGGSVRALGVGSDILGRGADVLIIDDAINDAFSVSECATAIRWFREQAFNRLNAGGRVVIIGQRLSEMDLCGEVLKSDLGGEFRVINLPALAEEDDPLGRAPGEPLWPEIFGVEELGLRRAGMGSRAFETQYQGHVSSIDGTVFKRSWFQHTFARVPRYERTDADAVALGLYRAYGFVDPLRAAAEPPLRKITAIDCASKTGLSNDYTAIVTIVFDGQFFYVVDVQRDKLEFPDLMRRIIQVAADQRPQRIYIEEASAGIAVCQELRHRTRLNVIPVPPKGSKRFRAETVSPNFEAGRVLLPENAAWDVDAYVDEFCNFDPSGTTSRHDDMVDATALAIFMLEKIDSRARSDQRNELVLRSRFTR